MKKMDIIRCSNSLAAWQTAHDIEELQLCFVVAIDNYRQKSATSGNFHVSFN